MLTLLVEFIICQHKLVEMEFDENSTVTYNNGGSEAKLVTCCHAID